MENLLVKTNLWDARNKSIDKFSGGMKQRYGIAQALLGNPTLLIVDEPTAGLDPAERRRFQNILAEVGEETVKQRRLASRTSLPRSARRR